MLFVQLETYAAMAFVKPGEGGDCEEYFANKNPRTNKQISHHVEKFLPSKICDAQPSQLLSPIDAQQAHAPGSTKAAGSQASLSGLGLHK